jgi:hypothetical protein
MLNVPIFNQVQSNIILPDTVEPNNIPKCLLQLLSGLSYALHLELEILLCNHHNQTRKPWSNKPMHVVCFPRFYWNRLWPYPRHPHPSVMIATNTSSQQRLPLPLPWQGGRIVLPVVALESFKKDSDCDVVPETHLWNQLSLFPRSFEYLCSGTHRGTTRDRAFYRSQYYYSRAACDDAKDLHWIFNIPLSRRRIWR